VPRAQFERHVELAYQLGRQRHLTDNATPPPLQGFEGDDAVAEIESIRPQRQRLGNAAAAPEQHAAEQSHRCGCHFQNCVTLCKKIYRAAGAAPCIAQYQCSQYAGHKCASAAYVNARYVVYCGSHSCVGGSTR